MTTSVVIVEDDQPLREALVSRLRQTDRYDCPGHSGDPAGGVALVLRERPDVTIMDIQMPGGSGVDCVREIIAGAPDARILMYTAFEDTDLVYDALRAGASGYILKRRGFDELCAGIDDVMNGGAPMSPRIARKVIGFFRGAAEPEQPTEELTERERDVLEQVAAGASNKVVARNLDISPETVKVHLRNVYSKWQVRNRTEAALRFREQDQSR